MPIYDGSGNVVLPKKKGPGRPKKDSSNSKKDTPKTPKTQKVKTQFTFYEYLKRRFKLSFIAGMFKEAETTLVEWDMLVRTLANLLKKKILEEK